jgi:sugar phosphate isomerase/epimerase
MLMLRHISADAVRFIHDVGLPNVKVYLDSFHMIREEDDFVGAVRETGRANLRQRRRGFAKERRIKALAATKKQPTSPLGAAQPGTA